VNWDSSVSTATDYVLDHQITSIRFQVGTRNLSLRHHIQTSSAAHPASHPMGTEDYFPGSKVAGV